MFVFGLADVSVGPSSSSVCLEQAFTALAHAAPRGLGASHPGALLHTGNIAVSMRLTEAPAQTTLYASNYPEGNGSYICAAQRTFTSPGPNAIDRELSRGVCIGHEGRYARAREAALVARALV